VQLTAIFVLEKTMNIPNCVHNGLGHPQSILVSCWSICICSVVYFLKGHFLNLNVFSLLYVSADNNLWLTVLGVLSRADFAMLHLKELCLFLPSFPLWALPSELTPLQYTWSAPALQEKPKGAFLNLERIFWTLKCFLSDGLAQYSSAYLLPSPSVLFQVA